MIKMNCFLNIQLQHRLLAYQTDFNSCDTVATIKVGKQCKNNAVVELMDLEPDKIHIAEYWLKLPPKEVLQAKLHKAMLEAKSRLEFQRVGDSDE
jgi:hypothetical protein